MYFYDTCALLNNYQTIFKNIRDESFIISSITLKEIEDIKVSKSKDKDIKFTPKRFTKIYYIKENGVDKTKTLSEERFLVLPNQVPYAYNDRVLQKQYRHAPKIKKPEQAQEQATKN